jgi:hypothetical protein
LLGLLVEGVGQVKDAARQFALCCFILFYLHSVGVGNNIISAASLSGHFPSRFLPALCSAPCLEPVVGAAVAEDLEVDLASERTTHLRWASHLRIYRLCQESRALFIPYVLILHRVRSS